MMFTFSNQLLQSLGFTLLHSIWQSAMIALAVFVLLRLMKNASALSRYYLSITGLLLMLAIPGIAFVQSLSNFNPAPEQPLLPPQTDDLIAVVYVLADAGFGIQAFVNQISDAFSAMAPYFVWFWLIGMIMMSVRLGGGYILAYRLKTTYIRPVEQKWELILNRMADKLHIRHKISLFESVKVDMPMVIGYLKPVILLPIGTLSRMPYDQVEMILAHELAHIRRADFLVNLIQSVVEVVLFFNPFVWWLSSVIRQEREHICDDMAMNISGKGLSLAKALVSLSDLPAAAMDNSAILYFNKYNTMKRIERLFSNPRLKPSSFEKMIVTLMALLVVIIISTTGTFAGSADSRVAEAAAVINGPDVNYAVDIMPLPDTLKDAPAPVAKEKREIYLEVENGKTVKAIVNGKEVPAEELEKEAFRISDHDTAITKRVIIKGAHPRYKEVIVETDEVEWNQKGNKPGKERKVIVYDDDKVFMARPKPHGAPPMRWKDKNQESYAIDMTLTDGDSLMVNVSHIDSLLRNAYVMQLDSAGGMRVLADGELDSVLAVYGMPKDGPGRGNRRMIYMNHPDVEGLRWNAQEMRRQRDMERELMQMEREASRMAEGQELEAKREEIESKRLELEAAREAMEANRMAMEAIPEPGMPRHMFFPDEGEFEFFMDRERPEGQCRYDHKYIRLFKEELLEAGLAEPGSDITLTRKQLIIDGSVVDNKLHKQYLKRFEEITGEKLDQNQAVVIR